MCTRLSFKPFNALFLALLVLLSSCHRYVDDILDELKDRDLVTELPERIDVMQPGLFPEVVEYDRFRSTTGLELDEARQRVLVPVTQTDGAYGALGIYDHDPIHYIELASLTPGHPVFANDVAVDKYGNAYVTNSYNGVIYKVDRGGEASLFFVDEDFVPPSGAFGFNGIVYHPKGFLIVAFSVENALYKIPLDAPKDYSKIMLNTELQGSDGLYLGRNQQELVVVNNAGGSDAGKVLILESEDAWESAREESRFETGPIFPTTATWRGGAYYVCSTPT